MCAQTVNFSSTTPTAPANAINVAFQNDNSNPPNISANVPSGVGGIANIVAKSLLTAQTAAISATTIFAIPSSGAGLYRITYAATMTNVGGGASVLGGTTGFQIKFTNANGDSVVKTSNPDATHGVVASSTSSTATSIGGVVTGYAASSTNLQYLMGYTASAASSYDLAIFVEYLGS